MNLLEFTKRFKDEQSCIEYLKELRLKQGITCKNCNEKTNHYWLNSVNKFQCSICRSRTNLKSGTIMEKSKVSLQEWFTVIHLVTSTKKSFSALELQRQVGFKSYQTIWYLMMKIRSVMGKRDSLYKLNGDIEIDEGFFTTVQEPSKTKKNELMRKIEVKRGRGTTKSKILVMVESIPVEQKEEQKKKHKKKRIMGYVKMVKIDSLGSKSINYEVQDKINFNSTVYTDGWLGYNKVTDVVKNHKKDIVKPKESMEKLPWVHTIISNSKKMCLGVHHSVNEKYIQNYLNEFCYKLNRRNFEYRDMFDGLMLVSGTTQWN